MKKWLEIIGAMLVAAFSERSDLALENLALRQQLATMKNRCGRPKLSQSDRLFWMLLSRIWKNWRAALHIVQPETVVRWHRQGFRCYWRRKSRRYGRPVIDGEVRRLIREISRTNPLWGAPRIHGELLKLGIDISQATVSKYMVRQPKPPSQNWRTFLENHKADLISLDFFTVPTATFRILFVLVVLSHDRRRILHFNLTTHPTAFWAGRQLLETCGFENEPRLLLRDRDGVYGNQFSHQARILGIQEVITAPRSPWQNAYAERVIGSIRRECIDHVIILGERHLKRIISEYVDYYNQVRTHLSLEKDAPEYRDSKPPDQGRAIKLPRVGGLHHEYTRLAA